MSVVDRTVRTAFSGSIAVLIAAVSCGNERPPTPERPDPERCELQKLGEASVLVEKDNIPDDQLVLVTGIGDPRSLVWQDSVTKQTYYLTRIMGTARRMYYMQKLAPGEAPRVLSEFEGHIRRWDRLPPKKAGPIASALERQYQIKVEPKRSYLITGGAKPTGCP